MRAVTLTPEALTKLRASSTATLSSQLLDRGYRNTFVGGLQPLRPDLRLVGYAFTLRYVPTREDLGFRTNYDNATDVQRLAVEAIGPEEVLVIDARGRTSAASFGHIIATRILVRGAAGLVTDGALRDTMALRDLGLPIYFRIPHAATSSIAHHAVEMNVPIGCGEVLVMPGDVIVGDMDGVVVIPADVAEEVAHGAHEQDLRERFAWERVRDGEGISDLYPLSDEQHSAYRDWRAQRATDEFD